MQNIIFGKVNHKPYQIRVLYQIRDSGSVSGHPSSPTIYLKHHSLPLSWNNCAITEQIQIGRNLSPHKIYTREITFSSSVNRMSNDLNN